MTPIQQTGLTPKLAEIVEKIKKLQQLTISTNFKTHRLQGALLSPLTADELVQVSAALQVK